MEENNLNNNPAPAPEVAPAEPTPVATSEVPTETPAQAANDEAIIEAYVGNNYQKISNAPFNVAAFFWNFFYLFYRKQYLFGFLAFALTIVSTIIGAAVSTTVTNTDSGQEITISTAIPCVVYTVISLILGFGFNKFYVASARRKIAQMRQTTPGISDGEIKGTLRQKGGVSSIALIGSIAMFIITATITGIVLAVTGLVQLFTNGADNSTSSSVTQNVDKTTPAPSDSNSATKRQFNGSIIYDTTTDYDEVISVVMPDGFEPSKVYKDTGFEYELPTGMSSCDVRFGLPTNFDNAETMITQMAEYYGETSEIGEISDVDTYEANGITWNYYLDSGIGENYFFGADVNNHIVYITFGTIAQDYYDTCADFMWEIVDGIEAVE